MEDFDQKYNDQWNNCYNWDKYVMIVSGSLTPKTLFEASLSWMEVLRQQEGNSLAAALLG